MTKKVGLRLQSSGLMEAESEDLGTSQEAPLKWSGCLLSPADQVSQTCSLPPNFSCCSMH
jgi:hypothetical protein